MRATSTVDLAFTAIDSLSGTKLDHSTPAHVDGIAVHDQAVSEAFGSPDLIVGIEDRQFLDSLDSSDERIDKFSEGLDIVFESVAQETLGSEIEATHGPR